MNKIIVSLCTSFLLFSSTLLSETVLKGNSFCGISNGSQVLLRWITINETNVELFEIEKKAGTNGVFTYIGSISPKHTPSQYEFVDYSALKSSGETLYQYRIKILFSEGRQPEYSETISVSHFVSGVRKTWGSIKAMFR
ncbi:MAG: hypothetical protein FJ218_07470 [Ignavibacteria bacterium]|nr:hypothetical protein [Ignavibacteria bacterium]